MPEIVSDKILGDSPSGGMPTPPRLCFFFALIQGFYLFNEVLCRCYIRCRYMLCVSTTLHSGSCSGIQVPRYVGHVFKLARLNHTDLKTQVLDLMPTRYLF